MTNERSTEDRLAAHAWASMPGAVHARLDNRLREHAQAKRPWMPALAAGLLIGVTIGAVAMYAVGSHTTALSEAPHNGVARGGAVDRAPSRTDDRRQRELQQIDRHIELLERRRDEIEPPVRLVVNASVFSDQRPALPRGVDPSSWNRLNAN